MLTETLPNSSRAEQPDPGSVDSASVDDGLRSLLGIRWLLIVGALVVAVSTVHLMAGAWGGLAPFLKAAVLIAGALAIGAAGDVLRHRLRLPAAGSALLFLYCGLVPLLAWGAAARSFWQADFGWPTVAVGLVCLVLQSRRVLRQVLGYEGLFFPLAFGALLLAVPVLDAFAPSADLFLLSALVLGLLARAASRHVNRFFFHRDRLAQSEKPVHLLPFAMLALVYGLAMSRLGGALEDLAVPLAFLALMLIDTGEEYYKALCGALGKPLEAWPRRSRGLLALGFASLAAALAAAPFDASGRALFITSAIGAVVLLRWSLRYGSWISHGLGLLTAWLAYQTSPSLVRSFALQVHAEGSRWLDLAPSSPAWLAIGNLGAVFGLTFLIAVLGPRLGAGQRRVHAVFMAVHGIVVSLLAATAISVALWLVPLVALLLVAATKYSRRGELWPGFHVSATIAAICWLIHAGAGPLFALAAALVGVSIAQRILAEALERRIPALAGVPHRLLAFLGAGLGAFMAIVFAADIHGEPVWLTIFPAFAASLYFLVTALLEEHRGWAAGASMVTFAAACFLLLGHSAAEAELYWLPPGLALIGLSRLLRREMGKRFSLYVFSLGALCLYAMPTTALLGGLDWAWQSVLLVLSVGFGAASFRLRSRSLLILSSAALFLDLVCLAVSVHRATPILLWVAGLLFGLGLMAAAALLEHRREKLLQHVRVWGQQLAAWN